MWTEERNFCENSQKKFLGVGEGGSGKRRGGGGGEGGHRVDVNKELKFL